VGLYAERERETNRAFAPLIAIKRELQTKAEIKPAQGKKTAPQKKAAVARWKELCKE
jgi:hypothetical protein